MTQAAAERLHSFRNRLKDIDENDNVAYKSAQQEAYLADVDYNYCKFYPLDERFSPPPRSVIPGTTPTESKKIQIWNVVKQCMKDGTLQDLKEGKIPNGQRHDSESDGGMIIHFQDTNQGSPLSEGEIPEELRQELEEIKNMPVPDQESESDDDSERDGGESEPDLDDDSKSDDGDAMMDYSNANQPIPDKDIRKDPSQLRYPNQNARVLADLHPEDLNAQLRYFHVTKNPKDVNRSTLVKCLVCAEAGHMAEVCQQLTCSVCGVHNQHTTTQCPSQARCSKCRELGHAKASCPYKLRTLTKAEIVCHLCQRSGHLEDDCELLWRTSGRPWESDLTKHIIRLGCYECGRPGHLGNDCQTRRPGKSMGTSSWSLHDKDQASAKVNNGEINIKGRAQQHPIELVESDDEQANFYRPKIRQPAPKGQIRIVTGPRQEFGDHQPGSWTPINEPYRKDKFKDSHYTDYRDDRRDERYAGGEVNYSFSNYRPSYYSNRRSVSPQYRHRDADYRSDRYQPPLPQASYQERRPVGGGIYLPMPSSAQKAWNRHRDRM